MRDREETRKEREERRDFIKKLALGTAYAVPVMATFSLDSVRNKARAQSVYNDPQVVRAYQDPNDWRSALVDFDQPMNTAIGGAPFDARLANGACVDRTQAFSPSQPAGWQWEWTSPTQQKLTTSGWGGGQLDLTYNTQANTCTDFLGANGRPLVPWSGTVNMPD